MNKLTLFICSTLALVVSGCSVTTSYYTEQSGYSEIISNDQIVKPPVVAPAIPAEMSIEKRAYLEIQQTEFTKDLAKTGVIINKQGNDLLLYIPVLDAFSYNDFRLTSYGYTVLNKIGLDMLDQEFSEFTVSVYDGVGGHQDPNFNISEVRARVTNDYLISRGVNQNKISYKQEAIPVPPLIDPTIPYVEIRIKNDVNNYK